MEIFKDKETFLVDFDKKFKLYNETCKFISESLQDREEYEIFGFCKVCNKPSLFLIDLKWTNNQLINFRERMQCKGCHLNNRQRFMMSYVNVLIEKYNLKDIYLYEQVTPFFMKIKSFINSEVNVLGSEYLGHDFKSGQVINNIRHEDALNLSFKDEVFDLIISQDVLEHVPDFELSVKESYRVLKENGIMLFSIPFDINSDRTKKRAYLDEDYNLVHLEEEQYHGNPVSDKGSLVFNDFGWDIFDIFKKNGFRLEIITYNDYFFGHIDYSSQYCFIAYK